MSVSERETRAKTHIRLLKEVLLEDLGLTQEDIDEALQEGRPENERRKQA